MKSVTILQDDEKKSIFNAHKNRKTPCNKEINKETNSKKDL